MVGTVVKLLLDATALIDLERGRNGAAEAVAAWSGPIVVCDVALAEFGRGDGTADRVGELRAALLNLEINAAVAADYAEITNFFRDGGWFMGANDLWMAATARAHGAALLTRHARMFGRTPGLTVVGYGVDPYEMPIEFIEL